MARQRRARPVPSEPHGVLALPAGSDARSGTGQLARPRADHEELDGVVRAEIVAYAGVPDGFSAWPVSSRAEQLVLDGRLSEDRTGLLVANLAWLARPGRRPVATRLRRRRPPPLERLTEPRAVVDRILDATALSTQGGVRLVDDATRTVLDPGCCVQVDDWLDWADLLQGGSLVLGHHPELVVDVRGGTCVAWTTDRDDREDRGPQPHEPRVGFPAADVPGQLVGMRRDLAATIDRVGLWVRTVVPDQADDLVVRLRGAWGVTGDDRLRGVP